jgi:hypothetical protein
MVTSESSARRVMMVRRSSFATSSPHAAETITDSRSRSRMGVAERVNESEKVEFEIY